MKLEVASKPLSRQRTFPRRDQIAAEIAYFARCIREREDPEPGGWEGLADIRIIQAIQTASRFGRAVPVAPVGRLQRPDLGQQIEFPPPEVPAAVDVEQPTK